MLLGLFDRFVATILENEFTPMDWISLTYFTCYLFPWTMHMVSVHRNLTSKPQVTGIASWCNCGRIEAPIQLVGRSYWVSVPSRLHLPQQLLSVMDDP